METDVWIIGQIVIDIIMMCIIFWFVRSHYKKQLTLQNHETAMQKSEAVLSQMREISLVLERNLEEKRALSRDILEQLDQGLKRAEKAYLQISKIIPKAGGPLSKPNHTAQDTDHISSSIKTLLEKGLSKGEISQHLGVSVGEIDLLIKLRQIKKMETFSST